MPNPLTPLVRKYQRIFGLTHYRLRAAFAEIPEYPNASACVQVFEDRQEASIRVVPNWEDYDDPLEHLVAHELAHVVQYPGSEAINALLESYLPPKVFELYQALAMKREEHICNAVARATTLALRGTA